MPWKVSSQDSRVVRDLKIMCEATTVRGGGMILRAAVIGHICADLFPKLNGDERIISRRDRRSRTADDPPRRVRGEHRS
jgi:hypothetical protein